LNASWFKGPSSDIPMEPRHDRQILTLDMDARGESIVCGSADHGLNVYNMKSGKRTRVLFNKRFGHTDWVTTCAILNDGRIVSGSMDKRLCLWEKSAI